MHGAPFPCPPGKASLLLVCAHAWESRPFLELAGLQPVCKSYFPFPLQEGSVKQVGVSLLVTGSGRSRAALAVAAWLSHHLRDLAIPAGAGLNGPATVVANFGTAGAYQGSWAVGQTLLVAKVRNNLSESLYPERLMKWSGEEAECRTVPFPQTVMMEEDRARPASRQPVFDMEAFGVAEATTTFLSSANMVIGKCVSDEIPGQLAAGLDWKALAERCEADYRAGAQRFLEFALAHLGALHDDPRRREAELIKRAIDGLLAAALAALPLTVSQQRELSQHLRARLAQCSDLDEMEKVNGGVQALLAAPPGQGKLSAKKALARLLSFLRPATPQT